MALQLSAKDISERADEARKLSSSCRLCPRKCGVNRITGEKGYCKSGLEPTVAICVPHFGEEPPISGKGGAGTIFFNRCNMRCVYCQNYQISQRDPGGVLTAEALAEEMIKLQDQGCSTVEPVSPSHQLPAFLEGLEMAVELGLDLPIVYNTNGFESSETLDLLDGIVSVYLPDLKYSNPEIAARYSDTPDYVRYAREAILRMHDQVGNLVVDMQGQAIQGLIIRHLLLPGALAGTEETFSWIRDNLPSTITLSIMSQYLPTHEAYRYPELNLKISQQEYDFVLDLALGMGFENAFIQDIQSPEYGTPNFEKDKPFEWN